MPPPPGGVFARVAPVGIAKTDREFQVAVAGMVEIQTQRTAVLSNVDFGWNPG